MIKVIWAGRSGANYEFEVYGLGQEFLPVSGVYILCKPVGLVGFEALYVGETESLNDRLNTRFINHDGYKRALGHAATHVGVMRTYDQTYRLSVETDLRHSLDPVCNRQSIPINALRGGFGGLFG